MAVVVVSVCRRRHADPDFCIILGVGCRIIGLSKIGGRPCRQKENYCDQESFHIWSVFIQKSVLYPAKLRQYHLLLNCPSVHQLSIYLHSTG